MDFGRRLTDWLLRRVTGRSSRVQAALDVWSVPNETTGGDAENVQVYCSPAVHYLGRQ